MLPADERAEIIYSECIYSEYCIKPTTCCKIVDRNLCVRPKTLLAPCGHHAAAVLSPCGRRVTAAWTAA